MNSFVRTQLGFVSKPHVADTASVWLEVLMNQVMLFEVD